MAEKPETDVEAPEQKDVDADREMLGVGHSLFEAYLRRLVEDGDHAIERGDFVVAKTREELHRILRECWDRHGPGRLGIAADALRSNRDPGLANDL